MDDYNDLQRRNDDKKAEENRLNKLISIASQQSHYGHKTFNRIRRGEDGNIYLRTCTATEMKQFNNNNVDNYRDPFDDPNFGKSWHFFNCGDNIPAQAAVHYVHLIVGKQNVGKSTLSSALISPVNAAFQVAGDVSNKGRVKDFLNPPTGIELINRFGYRFPFAHTARGFTLKPSSLTDDKVFHCINRDGRIEKHYIVDTPGLLDTTDIEALHDVCRHEGPLEHLGFWPINNGKRSSCDLAYSHSLKREFSDHDDTQTTIIKSVTLCLGSIIDAKVQDCQQLIESFVRNFEMTIIDQGKVNVILNREGLSVGSYWIQNTDIAKIKEFEEQLQSDDLPEDERNKILEHIAYLKKFPTVVMNEAQFSGWYQNLKEFESLIRACLLAFSSTERGKAMSRCPIEFYPIDCDSRSPREMACFLAGRQSFLFHLVNQPNAGVNPKDLLVKKPYAQIKEHHRLIAEMLGTLGENETHKNSNYFNKIMPHWGNCVEQYRTKCDEFHAMLTSLMPLEQQMKIAAVKLQRFNLHILEGFRGTILGVINLSQGTFSSVLLPVEGETLSPHCLDIRYDTLQVQITFSPELAERLLEADIRVEIVCLSRMQKYALGEINHQFIQLKGLRSDCSIVTVAETVELSRLREATTKQAALIEELRRLELQIAVMQGAGAEHSMRGGGSASPLQANIQTLRDHITSIRNSLINNIEAQSARLSQQLVNAYQKHNLVSPTRQQCSNEMSRGQFLTQVRLGISNVSITARDMISFVDFFKPDESTGGGTFGGGDRRRRKKENHDGLSRSLAAVQREVDTLSRTLPPTDSQIDYDQMHQKNAEISQELKDCETLAVNTHRATTDASREATQLAQSADSLVTKITTDSNNMAARVVAMKQEAEAISRCLADEITARNNTHRQYDLSNLSVALAGINHHTDYLPKDVSKPEELIGLAGEVDPNEPNYLVVLGDWKKYVAGLDKQQSQVWLEAKTKLLQLFEKIGTKVVQLRGMLVDQLNLLSQIQVKLMEMNYFQSIDIPRCISDQLDLLHAGLPQCANGRQTGLITPYLIADEIKTTLDLFGDQIMTTIDEDLHAIAKHANGLNNNERYLNCVALSLTESLPIKTYAPTGIVYAEVGYQPMTSETIKDQLNTILGPLNYAGKADSLLHTMEKLDFQDDLLMQTLRDVSGEIFGLKRLEDEVSRSIALVVEMRNKVGDANFPIKPEFENRCFNEGWSR